MMNLDVIMLELKGLNESTPKPNQLKKRIYTSLYKNHVSGWGYLPSDQVGRIVLINIKKNIYIYIFQNSQVNQTLHLLQLGLKSYQASAFAYPSYVASVCGARKGEQNKTEYSNNQTKQDTISRQQDCYNKLFRQQNFQSMIMRVKIQNDSIMSEQLFSAGSGVTAEVSTATRYCVKILPDMSKFPISSGIANGVEVLIDLETFDNGDQLVLGDGVEILVTDADDYSLTELKGFPVGPGSAVDIKIKPVTFTISEDALKNFGYLDRKCIDTSFDTRMKKWNYSLSNCLVEATMSEIYRT